MMAMNETEPDREEDGTPEILISISQSIALKKMVAEGRFASFDEAIAKSSDELKLTKRGDDWYSSDAWEQLQRGMDQADRGELIPGEEVMARFEAVLREISQHE